MCYVLKKKKVIGEGERKNNRDERELVRVREESIVNLKKGHNVARSEKRKE